MQVAPHSELFLCRTLKTIQQDSLSTEDMIEVSPFLQAVAASQLHLVEVLARLASEPLLARRDACLDASDLDSEVKMSLRVQPKKSGSVCGSKFQEVVWQYKEGLAHKSLQMAVVGAKGAYFVFQASLDAVYNSFKHLVPRADLPKGGRISSFLKDWEKNFGFMDTVYKPKWVSNTTK